MVDNIKITQKTVKNWKGNNHDRVSYYQAGHKINIQIISVYEIIKIRKWKWKKRPKHSEQRLAICKIIIQCRSMFDDVCHILEM